MSYKVIWRRLPGGEVARTTSTFTNLSDAREAVALSLNSFGGGVEAVIHDANGVPIGSEA